MFGGSIFGGEDVNADALGGGGGDEGGGDYGQSDEGDAGNSRDVDPAVSATQEAFENTGNIEEKNSGYSTAQMINKGGGLFTSIAQMVGTREMGLAQAQRIYSRNEAKYRVANAKRAIEQYKEDSEIQRQKLSQSYFGRGIGESSIATEGMKYYEDTVARTSIDLDEKLKLAANYRHLVHSQIKESYAAKWLSFGNSVANLF